MNRYVNIVCFFLTSEQPQRIINFFKEYSVLCKMNFYLPRKCVQFEIPKHINSSIFSADDNAEANVTASPASLGVSSTEKPQTTIASSSLSKRYISDLKIFVTDTQLKRLINSKCSVSFPEPVGQFYQYYSSEMKLYIFLFQFLKQATSPIIHVEYFQIVKDIVSAARFRDTNIYYETYVSSFNISYDINFNSKHLSYLGQGYVQQTSNRYVMYGWFFTVPFTQDIAMEDYATNLKSFVCIRYIDKRPKYHWTQNQLLDLESNIKYGNIDLYPLNI